MTGSIEELPVTIGGLTLTERLGAGGMAEVFLATRTAPNDGHGDDDGTPPLERVVVKRMLPHLAAQPHFVSLFRREATTGMRVRHDNVCRTLDLVDDPRGLLLVVEYIDGLTLRSLARAAYDQRERLPLPILLRLIADAALGLQAIHDTTDDAGLPFVHRDISPDNLIVGRDGRTRVLDFGVARPGGDGIMTRTGELRGKLSYMSPEHIEAKPLDGRSDLYSLGVTLYWMLTGRRPFTDPSDLRLMEMVVRQPPPSVRARDRTCPAAVDQLVAALLSKKPGQRPASGKAVAKALEGLGAADRDVVAARVSGLLALVNDDVAPPPGTRREHLPAPPPPPPPPVVATARMRRAAEDETRRLPMPNAPAATTAALDNSAISERPAVPIHDVPTLDPGSEWGRSVAADNVDDAASGLFPPPTAATSARPRKRSLSPIVGGVAAGLLAVLVPAFALRWSNDDHAVTPPVTALPIAATPTPEHVPTPIVAPTPEPEPSAPEPTATATATATKTTTTTTIARAKPPPPKTVVVAGAPDEVVWRAQGRVIGNGRAALQVPAHVTVLEAEHAGGRIKVPIRDGVTWSALPHTVLSVRGHEGRVRIGAAVFDVPARVRLVAGRYVVRHTADDGRVSTYNVDATASQAVLTLKSAP